MCYRTLDHLTPNFLSELFPPSVGNLSLYNLRNSANIQTINASSNCYYNAFLSSVIREWNDLSEDIWQAVTICCFRDLMNHLNKTIPNYY